MNDQTKIATAVVAGYLLGRTKQGKRALRIALWLGGGTSGVASTLGQQGLSRLEANPAIGALLTQVRGPLLDAGRKALTSALENRANSLADNLHSRTEALGLPGAPSAGDVIDADQDEDEEEEQEEEAPPPRQRRQRSEPARRRTRQADADADEKPRRQQRTSRAKPDQGTTSARKSTGKSTAKSTGKSTAKSAPKAPASKTTASKREPAKRGTTRSSSQSRSRSGSQSGTTRRRGSTR